jgi:hypothetical protein
LLGTVSSLLKTNNWAPTQVDDQILEFLDLVLEKIYTGILRVERYLTLRVNGFTGRYEEIGRGFGVILCTVNISTTITTSITAGKVIQVVKTVTLFS